MDTYITGLTIKKLRQKAGLTQKELAQKTRVSDKAVSKWETGKGYPDISLLEIIAKTLGVSVGELYSGNLASNMNCNANMNRSVFKVCPICGNIIIAAGNAAVSCHGTALDVEKAQAPDEAHHINISIAEDEYYVTLNHEMSKQHYISFLAAVTDCGIMLTKCYPEQDAQARFKINRTTAIFAYCNRHGLFKIKL